MSDFWVFKTERRMCISLLEVKNEMINWKKPADLGEIHVFYQDRFLCRAICAELSGEKVTLKEIEQARVARRQQVRAELSMREAMVNRYVEMHHAPPPAPKTVEAEPAPVEARPRLKRYIND